MKPLRLVLVATALVLPPAALWYAVPGPPVAAHWLTLSPVLYLLVYALWAALALPGAAVLTAAGGAAYGAVPGFLLALSAATTGAFICFLVSRHFFADRARRIAGRYLGEEGGPRVDTGLYLFAARLNAAVPFFVVNVVAGLGHIPARTFVWISAAGMAPGAALYAYAGAAARDAVTARDTVPVGALVGLALLGLVPLVVRRFIAGRPPGHDLIVIGSGAAGLVAARVGAAAGAEVVLVEEARPGGECLHTGCVPSKTLVRIAAAAEEMRAAARLGVTAGEPAVDFSRLSDVIASRIAEIAPEDSRERYTRLGVRCVEGHATLLGRGRVRVGDAVLTARAVVVATGSRPSVPDVPGLPRDAVLTSDTVWDLRVLPSRLVILGGGPVACELGQAFARLGSSVTVIQRGARLLPKEVPDASAAVLEGLRAAGATVLLGTEAVSARRDERCVTLTCLSRPVAGPPVEIPCDAVLAATGRRAFTEDLGLTDAGVLTDEHGNVVVDLLLCTSVKGVYGAGDVTGRARYTHAAAEEGAAAALNALFGPFYKRRVDHRWTPRCTFTDPEVASFGEGPSAEGGSGKGVTVRLPLAAVNRAVVDGCPDGFMEVTAVGRKGRIVGATVVGARAGEVIAPLVIAARAGVTLRGVLGASLPYPTYSEAVTSLAARWAAASYGGGRTATAAAWYHRTRRRLAGVRTGRAPRRPG